ncbi:Hypothetical protein KVN_LOCUS248 [uncultured virus]|nr:Hypothetical protein KVN_LOCUS248 [uncultured virus]
MNESQYSHKKKKKIADKISKLKKKDDFMKIFEIIYAENKDVTINNNGFFMFFHKLSNDAYIKIENYLLTIEKKKKISDETNISETGSTERKEYVPYVKDEFPAQEGISPKLKFSNKEKNLIKRQRYDKTISSQTGREIIYSKFDVGPAVDSEKNIIPN